MSSIYIICTNNCTFISLQKYKNSLRLNVAHLKLSDPPLRLFHYVNFNDFSITYNIF